MTVFAHPHSKCCFSGEKGFEIIEVYRVISMVLVGFGADWFSQRRGFNDKVIAEFAVRNVIKGNSNA